MKIINAPNVILQIIVWKSLIEIYLDNADARVDILTIIQRVYAKNALSFGI